MSKKISEGPCVFNTPMGYRTFFDLVAVFLVVLCKCERVAMINPMGCKILGKRQNQIVNQNWFENFIPSVDRKKTLAIFNRLAKGELEPLETFQNRILTAKGERLFLWHNSYIKDDKGAIRYLYSAGVDITDLKKLAPQRKRKV